jgi:hypothetical protein
MPEIPSSPCPKCFAVLDRASSMTGRREVPSPGDFSICEECGELLRFDDHLLLRLIPTEEAEELEKLMPDLWEELNRVARLSRTKTRVTVIHLGRRKDD